MTFQVGVWDCDLEITDKYFARARTKGTRVACVNCPARPVPGEIFCTAHRKEWIKAREEDGYLPKKPWRRYRTRDQKQAPEEKSEDSPGRARAVRCLEDGGW